eukprot:403343472
MSPLHTISTNQSELKKLDQYDRHAQMIKQKFKWKYHNNSNNSSLSKNKTINHQINSTAQSVRVSPNRTTIVEDYTASNFNNQFTANKEYVLKKPLRGVGIQSQSAQNSPKDLKQSRDSSRLSQVKDKDNIEEQTNEEMRFFKPYQFPKRIYIRNESDRTQQLVQQANGSGLYETSHKNFYGKPVTREQILPRRLFDTQEDQTARDINKSVKSKNLPQKIIEDIYTSQITKVRQASIKRTETYEERKARIYKQASDNLQGQAYDSFNHPTSQSLMTQDNFQPQIVINATQVNSPIKVENQFFQGSFDKEMFNQTYSTLNNFQMINITEASPKSQQQKVQNNKQNKILPKVLINIPQSFQQQLSLIADFKTIEALTNINE